MKTSLDFVTLHFVRANSQPSSACILGFCAVQNRKIIERKEWLFQPTPKKIAPAFWQTSEIIAENLEDAPEFPEIWDEIYDCLDNQVILVHNKSHEIATFRDLLEVHGLEMPDFEMYCVLKWSRRIWKELDNHRKPTLAHFFGWDYQPANSVASVEFVANLAFEIQEETHLFDFHSIDKKTAPKRKSQRPKAFSYHPENKVDFKTLRKEVQVDDNVLDDHPLQNKLVVFTGSAKHFNREQFMTEVLKLGGDIKDSLTKNVNILVIGQNAWSDYQEQGKKSSKIKKAESYNKKYDSGIEIISEMDFIVQYLEGMK